LVTGGNSRQEEAMSKEQVGRRDFVRIGAASSAAAAMAAPAVVSAQPAAPAAAEWHHEADVVVAGGGAAGLAAAIRARDLGASVLVIDQNFDLGGRMLHSGAFTSLGGGDAVQRRDMAGESDREGFIKVPPLHRKEELDDNVELLFTDMTDWSIVDAAGQNPFRYNERDLARAWAENCPPTRQFLLDNYVRFSRVQGTHGGGGLSRARGPYAFLMLGERTDIKAGTVSREDAGLVDETRTSHFAPIKMEDGTRRVGPGAVTNGAAISRCLEFAAREKGIRFMLFRHLDEIVREQPFAGRVLGITASYTPRQHPETGALMQSLWQQGNVEETRPVVRIRARQAVVIATGGHAGNPEFRSMFYPALREPAFVTSGHALLGKHGQDASGIIAGMKVGATLAGMQQNLSYPTTFHIPTRLATRDAYTAEFPGHPTFGFRGSVGLSIGAAGFEELIAVNQVGQRFFNELKLPFRVESARFPGGPRSGVPQAGLAHKPLDWRNSRPEWVRQMYGFTAGRDAALAMNEGSVAPHYHTGPLWAIFDSAAVERTGWEIGPPYTNERNGYFFKADTIRDLALKIQEGNEFQRVPLRHLEATVATWNRNVAAGADPEFERHADAPMHRIDQPPFYAASIMVIWHDSYGGLRIDERAQVIDLEGKPIPGLYSGGEAAGGINKHGLGRSLVQGYMAATNAVREPRG
jgi:hypothetical protein